MPRLAPVALAALLLLGAVAAFPAGTASGEGDPADLRVQDTGASLRIDLAGLSGAGTLVVTHEDPILGTVVDRVVSLADGLDAVELAALRPDAGLRICALGAGVSVPTLPGALDRYDGAAVADLPALACKLTEPLGPRARNLTMAAQLVDRVHVDDARPLVTPDGRVVIVATDPVTQQLGVHVSHDGGHAYSARRDVTAPISAWWWDATIDAQGLLSILWQSRAEAQNANWSTSAPWRRTVVDPATLAVVSNVTVGGASDLVLGVGTARALNVGAQVVVAFDGVVRRPNASSGAIEGVESHGTLKLYAVEPNGTLTLRSRLLGPHGAQIGDWQAAAENGRVVVVSAYAQAETNRPSHAVATSLDGGATFSEWRDLPTLWPERPSLEPRLVGIELDALGTAHVSVSSYVPDGPSDAALLRIPLGGAGATATYLRAATPDLDPACSLWPRTVALHGLRVWAMWDACGGRVAESVDNGLTYGAPMRLREAGTVYGVEAKGMALYPEGRPLFVGSVWAGPQGEGWLASWSAFDPRPGAQERVLARANASYLRVEPVGPREIDLTRVEAGSTEVRVTNDADYPIRLGGVHGNSSGILSAFADGFYGGRFEPGESRVVRVTASNPTDAAENATVMLSASAWNFIASDPLPIRVRFVPEPIRYTIEQAGALHPGGSATFRVRAENLVAIALEPRTVVVRPGVWDDARSMERSLRITPLGRSELTFTVTASEDAEPGNASGELMTLTPGYAQESTAPFRIRITAPDAPAVEGGGATAADAAPPAAPAEEQQSAVDDADVGSAPADATAAPEDEEAASDTSAPGPDPVEVPAAPPPALSVGGGLSAGLVVGGSTVAVGAALVATEVGRWWLAVAASFYTRLQRGAALEHGTRARLADVVVRRPGIRFEELRRELGLASGVAAFHLRVLEREGHVVSRNDLTRRRFYPAGEAAPARDVHAAVSDLLRAQPGASQAEVARGLGMSRQLASYHLASLERAGIVLARREGGRVRYELP